MPEGTEAVTGAAVAEENADATKENFKIVGIIFGTFAGIALFVGSFIIWNTFTMTVTQRSREIALLRAIGARRRQVMGSLLLEAARPRGRRLGDRARSRRRGREGPQGADGRRRPRPAVHRAAGRRPARSGSRCWSGTVVTVVAAPGPGPARHQGAADRGAARVDPGRGEALEAAGRDRSRPSSPPVPAGMLSALYGDAGMKVFGLGLLAAMVGVMVALPLAVRPLAAAIAAPAAVARPARRAGEAERDAQPAPYLCDGGGPDDRPDPGREHGCLRLVPEGVVR